MLSAPSFGLDITDLPHGITYHNDVSWSDLAPILKAKFDWPRQPLVALEGLSSNLAPKPTLELKFPGDDKKYIAEWHSTPLTLLDERGEKVSM